jgi:alkylhydroperoxidase/carboxymuconolactone decarboxylase family protein YurZ
MSGMDDAERRAAGAAVRRRVLGHAHVDQAAARTTELTAEFQDLLTRYSWGEIWTGTLIALGRWDEFRLHARAALGEGRFTAADLKEIVLQQAVYCGIPAANTAFEALRDVVAANK